MLQLLTPTGSRPVAWALCQRWAMAQAYPGAVRWIIVDDGVEAQPITFRRDGWRLDVVRPLPHWAPGQNTQARNLLAGLDACNPAVPIVCWEDDDYYAPGWLNTVVGYLGMAELVGARNVTYYNLATRRWRRMGNMDHAAMSCTALRGAAIPALRAVAEANVPYLDARLWRAHPSRHLFDSAQVVSMKGLSGRPGIGRGHNAGVCRNDDAAGTVLRELLGEDARAYAGVIKAVA